MDLLVIGKEINNKYKLKRFIASGGMGDVWEAYDKILGRNIAIKFPRTLFVQSDSKALSILKSEAKTGAKLIGHPNIISVLDFGFFEEEGINHYYIVMELVNGIDVLEWINEYKGKIDESVYYRIGLMISLDLCKAIDYAHRNDILHRDIKPNNLFLSNLGITKIGDFGLSRFIEVATRTHTVKGSMTCGYAAPEQWNATKYTKDSDIYQIGCTIYHILTGELPFVRETLPGLMSAHLNQIPTLPNVVSNYISENLSKAILNAMEKKPDDRIEFWQLYEEIAKELIGTYRIELDVSDQEKEIIEIVGDITDFGIADMQEGVFPCIFADYGELLSESIQLILLGITNFKIVKLKGSTVEG